MKQLLIAVAACVLLAGAIAFSRNPSVGGLILQPENRNPWTNTQLNNSSEQFQFAIVSDRTGGHRAKIFSQAVERLNLMQPEFVVSVGDLIEGGRQPRERIEAEWKEFDSYVNRLTMPFFYVPGNHDVGNLAIDAIWQERYGRRWYHFVYKNVLFLILNSDDPGGVGSPSLGNEQVAYAKKALADNKEVRWTIVLLHKPIWTAANLEKRGWTDIEKALADRPYTVFCGHVHRYQKFVRQGRNYYQLATTGGGSKLRGLEYGEFDHIAWVTMKKDGPVWANVMLDSIYPDDLKVPESDEEGVRVNKQPTFPVRVTVYLDGSPLVGAYVGLNPQRVKGKGGRGAADGVTGGDGSFIPSSYGPFDGAPAGKYSVTVRKAGVPIKYATVATTDLTLEIPKGGGEFTLDLKR